MIKRNKQQLPGSFFESVCVCYLSEQDQNKAAILLLSVIAEFQRWDYVTGWECNREMDVDNSGIDYEKYFGVCKKAINWTEASCY